MALFADALGGVALKRISHLNKENPKIFWHYASNKQDYDQMDVNQCIPSKSNFFTSRHDQKGKYFFKIHVWRPAGMIHKGNNQYQNMFALKFGKNCTLQDCYLGDNNLEKEKENEKEENEYSDAIKKLKTSQFMFKLDIVYQSPNIGDIKQYFIFIHGLIGDPIDTWKDSKSGINLMNAVSTMYRNSVIIRVGYPSTLHSFAYIDDTRNLSQSGFHFLKGLQRKLSDIDGKIARYKNKNRYNYNGNNGADVVPIIFICHSLGGLITKTALVASSERIKYVISGKKDFNIYMRTKCIIFYGTPHRGSGLANALNMVSQTASVFTKPPVVAIGGLKKKIADTSNHIKLLQINNPYLKQIHKQFEPLVKNHEQFNFIKICSFVETAKVGDLKQVVSKESAVCGFGKLIETVIELQNKTHITMCKPESMNGLIVQKLRHYLANNVFNDDNDDNGADDGDDGDEKKSNSDNNDAYCDNAFSCTKLSTDDLSYLLSMRLSEAQITETIQTIQLIDNYLPINAETIVEYCNFDKENKNSQSSSNAYVNYDDNFNIDNPDSEQVLLAKVSARDLSRL